MTCIGGGSGVAVTPPTICDHQAAARQNPKAPVIMKTFLAALLVLAPFATANAAADDQFIAEEKRQSDLARAVAVLVPQERIETSVDIGRLAPNFFGGIIGVLVADAMDDRREIITGNAQERAVTVSTPLENALAGFDINTLALNATQTALTATEWLNADAPVLVPGTQWADAASFTQAHPERQTAIATYRYQLSPDFTQIQVIAQIQLADVEAEDFASIYSQQFVSSVRLNRPSFVDAENIAIWAADDALVAKAALQSAFARLAQIMPAVLDMNEAEFDAATGKDGERALAASFHGPLLFRDEAGPVIWTKDNGFIAAQRASD